MSKNKTSSFKSFLEKQKKKQKSVPSWVQLKTKKTFKEKKQKKHWRKNKL